MKHTFKIAGVIALEVVIIALLVGLAAGTIWLFHKGANSNWSAWAWICTIVDGIVTLILVLFLLPMSIEFSKEKIRKINEEN